MKYNTQRHAVRQTIAFNKKLNHLTGVIGLSNWTFTSPSAEAIKTHHDNAHVLRANAVHSAFKTVKNAIKTQPQYLYSRLRRYYRTKSMMQQLSQLDDHMLDDIGIERSTIVAFSRKQVQLAELTQLTSCSEAPTARQISNRTTRQVTHCLKLQDTKNCANDSFPLIDSACG